MQHPVHQSHLKQYILILTELYLQLKSYYIPNCMYTCMHYLLNSINYSPFYQLILAFCKHEQMNQLAPGVQKKLHYVMVV